MERGDVVVISLNNNVGKPRPALIIQNDLLNNESSLKTTIIIPLTSVLNDMEIMRYKIEPTVKNGLQKTSYAMIEKISQIEKIKVQNVVGNITKKQIREVEASLLAILGVN